MRVLASISFACALASWSAGTAFAVPTPLLGPQRVIPSATRVPLSVNPGVLYSFGSGADANPVGGLTYLNGILYGETCNGGFGDPFGLGTVFAVNAAGTERVIHSFGKGTDGACPLGGLVAVNDVLGSDAWMRATPPGDPSGYRRGAEVRSEAERVFCSGRVIQAVCAVVAGVSRRWHSELR